MARQRTENLRRNAMHSRTSSSRRTERLAP